MQACDQRLLVAKDLQFGQIWAQPLDKDKGKP